MVDSLYEIFGVTSSDVTIQQMTSNATYICIAGVVALGVIVGLIVSAILWGRR